MFRKVVSLAQKTEGKTIKMMSVKEAAVLLILASVLWVVVTSTRATARSQALERLELKIIDEKAQKKQLRLLTRVRSLKLELRELKELIRRSRPVAARKPRRKPSAKASLLIPMPADESLPEETKSF